MLEYICQVGTQNLNRAGVHHYGWNVLDITCSLKIPVHWTCLLYICFIKIGSSRSNLVHQDCFIKNLVHLNRFIENCLQTNFHLPKVKFAAGWHRRICRACHHQMALLYSYKSLQICLSWSQFVFPCLRLWRIHVNLYVLVPCTTSVRYQLAKTHSYPQKLQKVWVYLEFRMSQQYL